MRIVFFGSPAAALPSLQRLLEAGHAIELAVTQPDKPAGRGKALAPPPVKEFALARGIPVLQPEKIKRDEKALEVIRKINPDINVVVAYGQIIPGSIIYLPKFKSINVHFSLLPKYRGAAPVEWSILNGETKTGVTIFELNEKMDEGDILTVEEVDILTRETAPQLEARLARCGAELLLKTLDQIAYLPRSPQDHSKASLAPRLRKEDGKINWTKDAVAVERMVRAFSGWPGAYTIFRGLRILIRAGEKISEPASGFLPGQVVGIKREGLIVGCGQGSLFLVERLQREGKKEMEASSFLRGLRIEPGDFFS
ncbi:MAG: methionyl-tRNA formyltransferase [Clostridiales bacterium]|jgi:methionyl-tRNA formyltransferase|nr:methionyl-tRNA formyltransferase [Clostridiales bacterium]